jgi:multidrug transporter EmrE-like cation transporter
VDQLAIALLLVAALLHSAWHALIKTAGDRLVGLAGMNIVSTGVSLALLPLVSIPEVAVWPVLLFSVVLHNLYKVGLAQVYRHGDLSQAYPIARGLSPLFATLIAWGVLGEVLGRWSVGGGRAGFHRSDHDRLGAPQLYPVSRLAGLRWADGPPGRSVFGCGCLRYPPEWRLGIVCGLAGGDGWALLSWR